MARYLRLFFLLLLAGGAALAARADDILRDAVARWLDERDHWAFTQLAREYDGGKLKRERRERYDPSRLARWELLQLDGRVPTPSEKAELTDRKNRKMHPHTKPVADYFDFDRVLFAGGDRRVVRYELPLRSSASAEWLFPIEKVTLVLTIDKATRAITRVQARLDEPFRVALGVSRVLDVQLDIVTALPGGDGTAVGPAAAKPSGTARLVVTRFGDRVEYEWSDFQRVAPAANRPAPR